MPSVSFNKSSVQIVQTQQNITRFVFDAAPFLTEKCTTHCFDCWEFKILGIFFITRNDVSVVLIINVAPWSWNCDVNMSKELTVHSDDFVDLCPWRQQQLVVGQQTRWQLRTTFRALGQANDLSTSLKYKYQITLNEYLKALSKSLTADTCTIGRPYWTRARGCCALLGR